MTLEEKQALQTVLIDECIQRQQEQPTLLIDALLNEQGNALIQHVLSRRLAFSQQQNQVYTGLMKALVNGGRAAPRETEID